MSQEPNEPRTLAQLIMQIGWGLTQMGCALAILLPILFLIGAYIYGKATGH